MGFTTKDVNSPDRPASLVQDMVTMESPVPLTAGEDVVESVS